MSILSMDDQPAISSNSSRSPLVTWLCGKSITLPTRQPWHGHHSKPRSGRATEFDAPHAPHACDAAPGGGRQVWLAPVAGWSSAWLMLVGGLVVYLGSPRWVGCVCHAWSLVFVNLQAHDSGDFLCIFALFFAVLP